MTPTPDAFAALARSSPWRWRALHLTRTDVGERTGSVEAWVERPGRMVVRHDGALMRCDDTHPAGFRVRSDGREEPLPALPRPADVTPPLRPDGLVATRPDGVEYDDPMWQSYDWVAMLDPAELAHHVEIGAVREVLVRERPTWHARLVPRAGYDPRCGCCPLLWSWEADRWELGDGEDTWQPAPGTRYPDAYDVALDVATGVVVEVRPVGEPSRAVGFGVEIHAVDDAVVPPTC